MVGAVPVQTVTTTNSNTNDIRIQGWIPLDRYSEIE
jgi:hypothetical protein